LLEKKRAYDDRIHTNSTMPAWNRETKGGTSKGAAYIRPFERANCLAMGNSIEGEDEAPQKNDYHAKGHNQKREVTACVESFNREKSTSNRSDRKKSDSRMSGRRHLGGRLLS